MGSQNQEILSIGQEDMRHYIYSERSNLFEPNVYIQFLLQITGEPDPDDLVSAVKAAFAANETTMSRIVLEKDGTSYYEKMSESGCTATIVQEDWMELIRKNEKLPFCIKHGELIRAFVIPSNKNTLLLIMAHHLAGDGNSITFLIEDIMKALSGMEMEYRPLRVIIKDDFPKESKLPLINKLYADRVNEKWKQSGRSFTWEDYTGIHEAYWRKRHSQIVYENYSPQEVENIKLSAKNMGVTVNSYITTAFLRANSANGITGIAVDARLDHNRSMSNQVTGISVKHTYSEKESFAKNAQIVHKKIHKTLCDPVMKYFVLQFISLISPTLIDSVLLNTYDLYQNKTAEKLAKTMGYKGDKTRELGITNLARLSIPSSYGSYRIATILFIPPAISYAKHIIGVSTTEAGMTISYHFMSDQDEVEEREFFNCANQNIRTVSRGENHEHTNAGSR